MTVKIDLFAQPTVSKRDIYGRTAVVVDALRATSTIVTAVENGCREVIPVVEIAEAVSIAARLGRSNLLLCGERGGISINGFDLSNSPLEYTRERVAGKVLVMTTTNGTLAINAVREAKCVLLGSFLNARATADMLWALKSDVAIVCAGTEGRYSTEDVLAAGAIISKLHSLCELDMCDLSITAEYLYRNSYGKIDSVLSATRHYNRLKSLGFTADIEYCLREDVMSSVPIFSEGVVRKAILKDPLPRPE